MILVGTNMLQMAKYNLLNIGNSHLIVWLVPLETVPVTFEWTRNLREINLFITESRKYTTQLTKERLTVSFKVSKFKRLYLLASL